MSKWRIDLRTTLATAEATVTVEAESREEAEQLAKEKARSDGDWEVPFTETVYEEDMTVVSAEKLFQ